MAEGVRMLELEAASRVFEALPVRPGPRRLHPRYVAADAQRDPAFTPLYLCIDPVANAGCTRCTPPLCAAPPGAMRVRPTVTADRVHQ